MDEFTRAYFCQDPAWDKAAGLDIINQLTTAFLLDVLTQDAAAATAMDSSLYAESEGLDVQIVKD
jgi:hypothetical protein